MWNEYIYFSNNTYRILTYQKGKMKIQLKFGGDNSHVLIFMFWQIL